MNGPRWIALSVLAALAWGCVEHDEPDLETTEQAGVLSLITIPEVTPFGGPRPTTYEVFGSQPSFSVNVPGFDSLNRAYIRERTAHQHEIPGTLQRLRLGAWEQRPFEDAIRVVFGYYTGDICYRLAGGWYNAQIVFDRNDHAYTVVHAQPCGASGYSLMMLHSDNFGETWEARELELYADRFALERPYSPEALDGPPAILLWNQEGTYDDCPDSFQGGYGTLHLVKPVLDPDLEFLPAIVISSSALPIDSHSGGGTQAITHEGDVYVVWGETVDDPTPPPNNMCPDGSPVHVSVYDIGTSALVLEDHVELAASARSLPTNDSHNRSTIVMDTFERLHVIVGSHNCSFKYTMSGPGPDLTGWSTPTPTVTGTSAYMNTCPLDDLGPAAQQTYPAFVRDRDDRLHLVYRDFRPPVPGDDIGYYLVYQSKNPAEAWSDRELIAAPPHNPYSVYYHQLTIDHYGHLYLLLSYYTDNDGVPAYAWFADPVDGIYEFSHMLVSSTGGLTWQWATTQFFDSATFWTPASGAIGDIDNNSADDVVHVYWDHGLNVHIDGSQVEASLWQGWDRRGRRLSDGPGVLQFPVLVGDVNGDDRDDLVFVYRDWALPYRLVLRTHFAQADGTFSVFTSDDLTGLPNPGYPPLIGDVTGDGRADVVLMWRTASCLNVRTKRSNGDGTWSDATTCLPDGAKVHQYPTRLGDVNATIGNERADLVFAYRESGYLKTRVKFGNVNGTFTSGPQQTHNDGPGIHQYPHVLGDVDGNGWDDLVFLFRHWGTGLFSIRVMYSLGNGNFASSIQTSHPDGSQIPDPDFEVLIGRANTDACEDLVFPFRPDSDDRYRIRTFLAGCAGSTTANWTRTTSPPE